MVEKIIKEIKVYEVLDRELYYNIYFSNENYIFAVYGEDAPGLRKLFLLDFTGEFDLSETGVFPCTINERPKKVYAKLVGSVPVGTCLSDLYQKSADLGPTLVDLHLVTCTESLGMPYLLPRNERQDIHSKIFLISRFVLDKLLFSKE